MRKENTGRNPQAVVRASNGKGEVSTADVKWVPHGNRPERLSPCGRM